MKKIGKFLIGTVFIILSTSATVSSGTLECPEGSQLYGFLTTCETGGPHFECFDKLISKDDLLSIAIEYESACD